ncbi:DUF3995 domain-containing protein [Ruania zhangjianzhongii]|uniref:DUF3995 domain-containing protein n=1 Tax=Ruania zhangjianzhongii TaxID=2603206 RepID=UPI0011CC1355|nr:DUF3995 domain-containing protein [Ruania zhangjianzhongii]
MRNPYAPPDPSAPPPVRRRPENGQDGEQGPEQGPGWQDPHAHDPRRPLDPRADPRRRQDPRQQRPERKPPTPEEAAAAGKSVLKFGAALLVAMLAMRWPIPWQLVAPAAGLLAVYLGVRALITYRKVGMTTFASVFLMLGVAIATMLALSSLTLLTMWNEQVTHQECMDRALTVQSEQACTDAYDQALQERLNPAVD